MSKQPVRELDAEALALFARKGFEGGPNIAQGGQANAAKVRRVIQITADLSGKKFDELRILDLGCGEGVYAIEAGLHGAHVVAVDARTERMNAGAACAARHEIRNVQFIQEDVRRVSTGTYGRFDVVYLLGLLYHLDTPDVFRLLENACALCDRMVVIDTLIALTKDTDVEWQGCIYHGQRYREHEDNDSGEVRRGRVLRSIDNTFSFRFTRESLIRALQQAGFSTVFECYVPFEPGKAADRITLVAMKGVPVLLSTYPWINNQSELEIEKALQPGNQ
jgi:SAM-dependent methyltransferase